MNEAAARPLLPVPLVTTDWLAAHLGEPDLRVIDASFKMPGVAPKAAEDYAAAHIAGAVFFDIDDIADETSELPHMLPPPAKFAARMRRLGIADSSRVVAYDGNGVLGAARAWWMLRCFGHEAVAVLDGGLKKWRAEGRPVTAAAPEPPRAHFSAQFDQSLVRSAEQVLDAASRRTETIIDARAAPRFTGAAAEPRAGLRQGHIPASRNLDHASLVRPDGTMLPPERLAELFREAGIAAGRPVITSCGSGVSACVLALGLYLVGRRDVAVYDGSWAEWGRAEAPGRPSLPIETGPARG